MATFVGTLRSFKHIFWLTNKADGDSGSWVIDKASHLLFGHIASGYSDSKTAYIIPAASIFDEIATLFGSEVSVSTPLNWTSQDDAFIEKLYQEECARILDSSDSKAFFGDLKKSARNQGLKIDPTGFGQNGIKDSNTNQNLETDPTKWIRSWD